MRIGPLLKDKRVVVFLGSGGVGKTTVSAATGVYLAQKNVKTLVMTMDPARRLANALGLKSVGNEVVEVEKNLYCMMLDSKQAFDELMTRYLEKAGYDQERIEAVMTNPFYQGLSDAFIGSQEYVATGKLYDLLHEEAYETVVVDTPPTKHAVDFIEAPSKLIDVFDSRVVQLLVKPYGVLQRLGNMVLKGAGSLTGSTFLQSFASFFSLMDVAIYEDFRARARKMQAVLQDSRQSCFFQVASPRAASCHEALKMIRKVRDEIHLAFGGCIVNRKHENFLAGIEEDLERFKQDEEVRRDLAEVLQRHGENLDAKTGYELLRGILGFVDSSQKLARTEEENVKRILVKNKIPVKTLPSLPHAVSDLRGLKELVRHFD